MNLAQLTVFSQPIHKLYINGKLNKTEITPSNLITIRYTLDFETERNYQINAKLFCGHSCKIHVQFCQTQIRQMLSQAHQQLVLYN